MVSWQEFVAAWRGYLAGGSIAAETSSSHFTGDRRTFNMKDVAWLSVFISLWCLAVAAESQEPGICAIFTQNGLDYSAKVIAEVLKEEISCRGIQVPDQSGSLGLSVGEVEYYLTEINIRKFKNGQLSAKIDPGVGVNIALEKGQLTIDGKFSYKYTLMWIPTWNSGTFNLTISDIGASFHVILGMDSEGGATFDINSCSSLIGSTDLSLQACSANWILNLFTDSIKSGVEPMLKDKICDKVLKSRDAILEQLAQNTKLCIDKNCSFVVDLLFASAPEFEEGYIETKHRGEVMWKNDTVHAPFQAPELPDLKPSSKMISLYFSSYIVNTLFYAMYKHDRLSYRFTKKDLSWKNRGTMDTNCKHSRLCITNLIPEISDEFPESTVELEFVATCVPRLDISNNDSTVAFEAKVSLVVRLSNETLKTAGVFFITGSASGYPYIEGDKKHFTITQIKLTQASLSNDTVPTDSIKDADPMELMQKIAVQYLQPKLNDIGKEGFPMPTAVAGLLFSEPVLRMYPKGYFFESDFIYLKTY